MKAVGKAMGIVIAVSLLVSCTKNSSSPGPVTGIITTGNWVVTLFSEPGENKTSDFSGYSFSFQSDGKLLAIKNGVTKQGSWTENNSSNKLIIDLGVKSDSNKPLGELTDDWKIVSRTDTKISLTDDNSSSNEVLEFSKQ